MNVTKKNIVVTCLFITFSLTGMMAQDDGGNRPMRSGQLKSFAKSSFRQSDFHTAALYYESYCEKKPNDYRSAYRLAESYRLSKDYRLAETAYADAYELNPKKNTLALFHYATMLKMNGQYEKSDAYYAKFKKEYKGKDKSAYLKMIGNNARAALFANELVKRPGKISINHLNESINTGHVEAAPCYINDSTLLFSSLRTDQKYYYVNPDDTVTAEPERKLYTAVKANGKWEFNGEFHGPFNSAGFHTSNGTFSPDGNRFYFTRCKRNRKNKVLCSIWVSNKSQDGWDEPVSLGEQVNLAGTTSTQPAVAVESQKKRETVYFISDRERGRGGTDIWYTFYDSKKKVYTNPLNAGPKINTPGDETTPYYDHVTHDFYFSSNGWQGIGGLDIFKTSGELKKWSAPENLGSPLNSSYDDLYYVLAKTDKESGMYISNREIKGSLGSKKGCCDDFFEFRWLDAVKVTLDLTVMDESDINLPVPVRGAKVFLEVMNDEDTTFVPVNGGFTDEQGKLNFSLTPNREYRVVAKKEGFLAVSKTITTQGISNSVNLHEELRLKEAPLEAMALQNIYYEYSKATLTEAAKTAIDTTLLIIMQNNPELVIELSSHTDHIGKDEDNLTLSQARAESVVQYLIGKGINPELLHARGFGETKPVAPNQLPDGTDNPEGRQLNRRTEFRIVGKLLPDGKIMEPGNF